jgi:ligand-binding sensor domain-containing protein
MKKFFIIFSFFIISFSVLAEKRYGTDTFWFKKPFLTDYITALCPDEPFLWIGTEKGLVMYTGKVFKLFYADYYKFFEDKAKLVKGNSFLLDNRINDLLKIGGKLYIATDGGISIFDYEKNTWSVIDKKNNILESNYVQCLEKNGGDLWIGTMDKGLYIWHLVSGEIEKIKDKNLGKFGKFNGEMIKCLKAVKDKDLVFVGTLRNGLYIYNKGTWKNITAKYPINSLLPSDRILSLEFYDKKLWIGTNKGLVLYDGRNFKLFNENTGIEYPVILSLKEIDGDIYVGTGRGLYRINKDLKIQKAKLKKDYRILDICKYKGKIWLATQNNGLIELK